jgi:kynurenine formamidase
MEFQRIEEILENAPSNWGRWGEDDEKGAVNLLTPDRILDAVDCVREGTSFTLGIQIAGDEGAPMWPTRSPSEHYMTLDKGHVESGKVNRDHVGGWEASDDLVHLYNHGTTHVDAPGHVWYDDQLYNGFDAKSTMGGLDHGDIEAVAEHGIVGKGVLLDLPRHRGVDRLAPGEQVTVDELEACAEEQGVDVADADVLLLRLGVIELFYDEGEEAFYEEYGDTFAGSEVLREPGPTYTDAMAEWFADTDLALYATDSISAEQVISSETGTRTPLHPALLRDLGTLISELNWLQELADDCAEDGRYEFLYVASPFKLAGGTGSPINPIVVK